VRRTLTVLSTVVMVALVAGPAAATIIERGGDDYEYQFTDDEFCGFELEVTGEGTFDYRIREGKNRLDQTFFLHVVDHWTETVTAGDRSITLSFRLMFRDVRAVPLGDGLFRFSDVEAGTVVVRDADGEPIAREAGAVRATYVFDTLNDDQPGGDLIGEVDRTFHGRFDDLDAVICRALDPSGP
jgi:hypothetical protein